MAKKPYDEVSVVRTLSRNRGIEFEGRQIIVNENQTTVGNGTWGKIDYLCKVHRYNYRVDRTNEGKHKHKNYSPKIVNPNKKDNAMNIAKTHPTKINMVNMTKIAMKNSINNS